MCAVLRERHTFLIVLIRYKEISAMRKILVSLILSLVFILSSCGEKANTVISTFQPADTQSPIVTQATTPEPAEEPARQYTLNISDLPAYSGNPFITINNNIPFFTDAELATEPFERYSPLDNLGRCGVAYANICKELMPTEERQGIGQVKPAGWHTIRYKEVGAGSEVYLYNRCHLIGFQLAGENANELNLITGTRYLNIQGMLPFENRTAEYVKSTNNHALYRVTPIYDGNNLLCYGVQIETKSVEDNGKGLCFNVFCYNVQPHIIIDYATGNSWLDEAEPAQAEMVTRPTIADENTSATYILNTNTKKFHYPSCSNVADMKEKNKKEFTGSRDDVISQGYVPCKRCAP